MRLAKGFLAWPLWFDGFFEDWKWSNGFFSMTTLVISRDFFNSFDHIYEFWFYLKVALVDWIFVEARPRKWMPQLMTSGKLWGPRSKNKKYRSIKHWNYDQDTSLLQPNARIYFAIFLQISICNKFVTKYKNKTYEQCHLVTVAFIW